MSKEEELFEEEYRQLKHGGWHWRKFQEFLAQETLQRAGIQLREIRGLHPESGSSEFRFLSAAVGRHLDDPAPGTTVRAVCSRKSEAGILSSYALRNVKFARELFEAEARSVRDRVIRVFLEPAEGFSREEWEMMQLHDANSNAGMRALVIPADDAKSLGVVPEFEEELKRGLGFVVLRRQSSGSRAFVHWGFGEELQYTAFGDEGLISLLEEVHRTLAESALPFDPRADRWISYEFRAEGRDLDLSTEREQLLRLDRAELQALLLRDLERFERAHEFALPVNVDGLNARALANELMLLRWLVRREKEAPGSLPPGRELERLTGVPRASFEKSAIGRFLRGRPAKT